MTKVEHKERGFPTLEETQEELRTYFAHNKSLFARFKATVYLTARIFSNTEVEQRAAAFAYYVFFSLIPLLVLIIAVGSYFLSKDSSAVNSTINHIVPLDNTDHIWKFIGNLQQAHGGASIISFIVLIWASIRFFQSLVMAVNRAWHTVPNPWWHVPIKNFLLVAVLCSAVLLGIIAPALVQSARDIVLTYFTFLNFDSLLKTLDISRYAIGSLVLFYCFSLLYMIAPRVRVKFTQVWVASLIVTILLQVVQNIFVNWVPKILNYNALYGTVGAFMFLLMWIYFSGVIIIGGACLSSASTQVKTALEALRNPPADPTIPSTEGN